MQFDERLRQLMKQHGVTNYRLAKEIGCSASTVATWVDGDKQPSAKYIQSLAGYFGVSTDYLMGSDDTDTEENSELRTMFSITRNATPEQLRQYINVIKAIRGED